MRAQTYIILAFIFALIVAIFAVINVEPVEVNYLFGTGNAPLILVILISVLMGGLITATVGVVRLLRLQRKVKTLEQQIVQLEQNQNQVDEVKEIEPIVEDAYQDESPNPSKE